MGEKKLDKCWQDAAFEMKDVGCKIYLGGEAVVQVTGGQVRLPFVCSTYPAQDEGRGVRAECPACAILEELFLAPNDFVVCHRQTEEREEGRVGRSGRPGVGRRAWGHCCLSACAAQFSSFAWHVRPRCRRPAVRYSE